jgi:Pentapeptide repeats (8 copies)
LAALSAKDRQDLWDSHRQRPFQVITALITSVGVLFGVAFTAFGLIYTARTLETAQEGQVTDRYTKAVEQLASPAVDVRLGGIYALQRLATDSSRDRLTVRNVLASFVRHHDFCVPQPPAEQCTAAIRDLYLARTARPLPTDVGAALTTALSVTGVGDDLADFSQTRFPRVSFAPRAHVQRADLTNADLVFAGFSGANLAWSRLSGSCLTYANLTDADLSNADLSHADLYEAQISHAKLTGADLRGADLRNVFGMTPAEIQAVAVTNSDTKFGQLERRTEDVFCGPQAALGIVLHAPAN